MSSTRTRGFTLIELLVVIAIIGILSSVVLASLNTARVKSRDARRISDVKQLQLALALYYDANSGYPATLASLAPTYIATVPTDPTPANGAYKYACSPSGSATGSSYHLGAILEDTANAALSGDGDFAAAGSTCTGSASDFAGASAACTAIAGTDQCYDMKP